ncbi:MAG: hypothetical protein FJ096_08250 [Deltaproteobacteria bacterium]|nr:hypothetical protein [Deltaproteobacteria bacterium]
MRLRHLAPLVLTALACTPPVALAPRAASTCEGTRQSTCEQSIASLATRAEAPSAEALERGRRTLVELDAARGRPGLAPLADKLRTLGSAVPLLRIEGQACDVCETALRSQAAGASTLVAVDIPAGTLTTATSRYRLLAGLARLAGTSQLLVAEGSALTQVFGRDPMLFAMAGTGPHIGVMPSRASEAVALANDVDRVFVAAATGDYAAAARLADLLEARTRTTGLDDEPAVRARDAIAQLARAGLTYERATDATAEPQATPPADVKPSSAYAALGLARFASDDRARIFPAVRATLAREIRPDRLTLIEINLSPTPPCVDPPLLDFTESADLLGLASLAGALDPNAGPSTPARSGSLPLTEWLPRFEAALGLAERTGLAWLATPHLLAERGSLAGLDLEGSVTWRRVTKMALDHVDGMRRLAAEQPARFRQGALASLAMQPGTTGDPALREATARLVAEAVKDRILVAKDAEAVLMASVVAAVLALGMPPHLQGPQIAALATAVDAKLTGDLAAARGWHVAFLQLATTVAQFGVSDPRALAALRPRLAAALASKELPHPVLAELAKALAAYGELALGDRLEVSNANPKRMSNERREARRALEAALGTLAESGPRTPPEADLLLGLSDYGDAVLGIVLASLREPPQATSCGTNKKAHGPELEGAIERARKKRRHLLGLAAMTSGDGPFVQRARLIALLLSDALDIVDGSHSGRDAGRRFAVATVNAERIVGEGLAGWLEGAATDAARGAYQLWRAHAATDGMTGPVARLEATRKLTGGLRRLFEPGSQRSLFALVDDAVNDPAAALDLAASLRRGAPQVGVLEALAGRAYDSGAPDQGDMLLLVASALKGGFSGDDRTTALALAERHRRPIVLGLLLRDPALRGGRNPGRLAAAVKRAGEGQCRPPDGRDVLDLESALGRFRNGDRKGALADLERLLARGEEHGVTIPRQSLHYREASGRWVFRADFGLSLAGDFIRNASQFNLGLGTEGQSKESTGKLEAKLDAGDGARKANEHALRHHAHLATLTSVLARLDGNHSLAASAARRAIAAYMVGARLGHEVVAPGPDGEGWPADATTALALAAQQAVEAGELFLAGQLWGLVSRAVGPGASDDDVVAITRDRPAELAGLLELDALASRTARSLETLLAPLACTEKTGDAEGVARVSCDRYPLALSLRIADALPELPRLAPSKDGEDPESCQANRALDAFLGRAASGSYDPVAFVHAVAELRRAGRHGDAAALLGQQRRAQHCTPAIVEHARALGRDPTLGVYLRADALSAVVMCGRDGAVDDDLVQLEALTARHAVPVRNFEVLLHAALRAREGRPAALLAITHRPDFIAGFRRRSPDLALLGLVAQAAAERLASSDTRDPAAAPTYGMLCSTFPSTQRGPLCNTLEMLQGASGEAAAMEALARFIGAARSVLEPRQSPESGAQPKP